MEPYAEIDEIDLDSKEAREIRAMEARKYYVYWHKNNSRDWFKDKPKPTKEELKMDYECHILW